MVPVKYRIWRDVLTFCADEGALGHLLFDAFRLVGAGESSHIQHIRMNVTEENSPMTVMKKVIPIPISALSSNKDIIPRL